MSADSGTPTREPAVLVPSRSRSLSWHLGVMSAGLALPILAFAAFLLWQLAENERGRLEAEAVRIARSIGTAIDRDLNGVSAALDVLARSPQLLSDDIPALHSLAVAVEVRYGASVQIRDREGRVLLETRPPDGASLGRVVNYPQDSAVLQSGRTTVSGVIRGTDPGAATFAVHAPVVRQGEVRYFITLGLPATRVRSIILDERPPTSWTIAVADEAGLLLARKDRHEEFVGRMASPDFLVLPKGQSFGTWYGRTLEGEEVLGAFANAALADWRVAVGVRRAELVIPLQRSLALFGALGAALLSLSVVLTLRTSRRILKPIGALQRFAAGIGRGEAPSAPPATGVLEFDRVGDVLGATGTALVERERALEDAASRLKRVLDDLFASVAILSPEGVLIETNREPVEITGLTREDFVGRPFWECWWWAWNPDVQQEIRGAVMRAARGEVTRFDTECRIADGARIWVDVQIAPLRDAEGRVVDLVASSVDITERKRVEARLRRSEESLRLAIDSARLGVFEWETGADLPHWQNARMYEIFGLVPGDPPIDLERFASEVVDPEEGERMRLAARDVVTTRTPIALTTRIRRADGDWRWIELSAEMVEGTDRLVGVVADVTEMKEAEARHELMIRELHHRVKNTLQTVQSIASSTLRTTPDLATFRRSFIDRLASLARTHTLLVDHAWDKIGLSDLVHAELAAYAEGDRIAIAGPQLALPSDAALALGMALHELATNAVKHGALSVAAGRVAIDWSVDPGGEGPVLRLNWTESRGPKVRAPEQTGFGTRLLTQVLGHQLGGQVELDYASGGLQARFQLPLTRAPARSHTGRAGA